MIGQSIVVSLVQQQQCRVLHRDVHAGNLIVTPLLKPFALSLDWNGDAASTFPCSFLVSRFDWSESVPYGSVPPQVARQELAIKAHLLGHHARRALQTEKILPHLARSVIEYPVPLLSDLADLLSEWLELLSLPALATKPRIDTLQQQVAAALDLVALACTDFRDATPA
jgi:hypothetical protein